MNGNALETFVAAFKDSLNLGAGERVLWVSRAMKINLDSLLKELSFDTTQYVMWQYHIGDLYKALMDREGLIRGFIIVSNKRLMFFKSRMIRSKSMIWKSIQLDPIMKVDIKDIHSVKFKENFVEIFYLNGGEMDIVAFTYFRGFYPEHPGYEQIPTLINFDTVAKNLREILSIDKRK